MYIYHKKQDFLLILLKLKIFRWYNEIWLETIALATNLAKNVMKHLELGLLSELFP